MERASLYLGLPVLVVIAVASVSLPLINNTNGRFHDPARSARSFLLSSPTFSFDGITDSITVDGVSETESGWNVTMSFSCTHAGYGNRSDEALPQVVTSHRVIVTVEKGIVSSAVIDDLWDEVKQGPVLRQEVTPPVRLLAFLALHVATDKQTYRLGETMTVQIRNASNQTVRFPSTAYGLSFELWKEGRWVLLSSVPGAEVVVSLEPGMTAEITVILTNVSQAFTSGKYWIISQGWMEQDGRQVQVWGCAEFSMSAL